MDTYSSLKKTMMDLVRNHGLESDEIVIKARPLTPDEAIGNPEDRDYPLITGRERMMQAEFRDTIGQAYTDMYGNYTGRLVDIARMELKNNYRRAIFISSLNAVMRYLGLVDKTVHCRDNEPRECSARLTEHILERYGPPRVTIVGFQPRMVESLAGNFEIKVTDMDCANIDSRKFGTVIQGPQKTREHLDWCDIALVTGSTIVNDTIGDFIDTKPVIFYGVTISGAARVSGFQTYCYCGR